MACKFELTKKSELYYPTHEHREQEVSIYGDINLPDGKTTFVKFYVYREEPGEDEDGSLDRMADFLTSKEFYRRMQLVLQPIGPLQNS